MTERDKNPVAVLEEDRRELKTVLAETGQLVYKCRGVSMLPLLRQNRDVFVLRQKTEEERCRRLDVVLFLRDNGQYVLHRILRVDPAGYWIVGDNCIGGEQVREDQVLGILTSIRRNGKTVRVTDRGYRIYSHLWCDAWPVRFWVLRGLGFGRRCLRYGKRRLAGLGSSRG